MDDNSISADNLTPKDISKIISIVRSNVLPDPNIIHNAGSFFKNPIVDKNLISFNDFNEDQLIIWEYSDTLVKVGAARLIELIRDKLKPSKNVSIYQNHSLVLITNGEATQEEILSFASQIKQLVYKSFNIVLDIEPNVIT
jgi:UDP-N-acetylmuramate dehydrogenase